MNSTVLATREIMWNIPASYKYTMYALFLFAVIIFVYGFYKKALYVSNGKLGNLKNLIPEKINFRKGRKRQCFC